MPSPGCKTIKGVSLPLSLAKIGNNAFYGCESLTQIDVPASVKSMGSDVCLTTV